ncbi:unnamed protein product, partial [Mesorhabditis belari]|uniref:thioredoxin-disulfide reductase (NADPH) n=1 Tax=Mesorhabditis belari TaxID=2138241 RepID=A0AAF3J4Y4_9BILA
MEEEEGNEGSARLCPCWPPSRHHREGKSRNGLMMEEENERNGKKSDKEKNGNRRRPNKDGENRQIGQIGRNTSPNRIRRFFTSIRERVVARVGASNTSESTGAVASAASAMAPRATRFGPVSQSLTGVLERISQARAAVVYSTDVERETGSLVTLLKDAGVEDPLCLRVDDEAKGFLHRLTLRTNWPLVYVKGDAVGGLEELSKIAKNGHLTEWLKEHQYDLVVLGGGSGGLAAAKEAARLGKKVACLDFVKPSTQGTTWGLGGTCVNVGCIPKKLMHQAAVLGGSLKDARKFGWKLPEGEIGHNWKLMRDGIQDHIGSLNWGYRVQLREKKVDYLNAYGAFTGSHEITCTDKKGKQDKLTADKFLIATGLRPKFPDLPGAKEYTISSDDLFALQYSPGKTLCIGASYVSLECAGFLKGIGLDVTVMVRSILLRGFDQDFAERIREHMIQYGVKFLSAIPTRIEELEPRTKKAAGRLMVYWDVIDKDGVKTEHSEEFNTVLYAIGREARTEDIGLEVVGVDKAKSGKVVGLHEQSQSVPWVYAIGDVLEGKPELTPVAIQAGRVLARRIFTGANELTEYDEVPTTVFTPLEYGCCGLPEEDAIKKYGRDNIIVYHNVFIPLEYTVAERMETKHCYCKLICLKDDEERVVGFHILTPWAGEITQGFAIGMKLGAKKSDFDRLIGIHPTVAENFTTLTLVKKEDGEKLEASGC